MFTRSVAKDCMARAVFEQPPVLDVILRNIQYENEVLTERDMVSLLLVFKTPVVVDVIEARRRRLRQQRFRKRMFVAQINELLETDVSSSDNDSKHAYIVRFMAVLAENKKHMLGTLFFANMCDHIRRLIEIQTNNIGN